MAGRLYVYIHCRVCHKKRDNAHHRRCLLANGDVNDPPSLPLSRGENRHSKSTTEFTFPRGTRYTHDCCSAITQDILKDAAGELDAPNEVGTNRYLRMTSHLLSLPPVLTFVRLGTGTGTELCLMLLDPRGILIEVEPGAIV